MISKKFFLINLQFIYIKDFILTCEIMCTILSVLHSLIARKSSKPIVVKTLTKSSDAYKNLSKSESCSWVKNSSENICNFSL